LLRPGHDQDSCSHSLRSRSNTPHRLIR
jgi:hypothetical protein